MEGNLRTQCSWCRPMKAAGIKVSSEDGGAEGVDSICSMSRHGERNISFQAGPRLT